jgi:perosamine synthetase
MDGYWMSTVAYDPAVTVTRQILKESFARGAIDARVFFYSLSSLGRFTK